MVEGARLESVYAQQCVSRVRIPLSPPGERLSESLDFGRFSSCLKKKGFEPGFGEVKSRTEVYFEHD